MLLLFMAYPLSMLCCFYQERIVFRDPKYFVFVINVKIDLVQVNSFHSTAWMLNNYTRFICTPVMLLMMRITKVGSSIFWQKIHLLLLQQGATLLTLFGVWKQYITIVWVMVVVLMAMGMQLAKEWDIWGITF